MSDEDLPRPPACFTPLPLDRLGIAELQGYIAELRGEVGRAEAEIARKSGMRSAADSVFRRS